MPDHQPEHLDLARRLVDENHPELAAFEIGRCFMRKRPSGEWLHVHIRRRQLSFDVTPASKQRRPRPRRSRARAE